MTKSKNILDDFGTGGHIWRKTHSEYTIGKGQLLHHIVKCVNCGAMGTWKGAHESVKSQVAECKK
ncbi:hypothetical protein ABGV42_00950 [Paenibacillus pabuli]|uniref:hypothetical protein n=1 Tax=Paenibacillus pabuli TaxID=1472 RepID=UPI003242B5D7